MTYPSKGSILCVLKVLQKYSDQERFLTCEEISDYCLQDYNLKIARKAITINIEILIDDFNYDIVQGKGRRGYALINREINKSQLTYLIDAVFSSKSIDSNNAIKISKALSNLFSIYEQKDYSYIYKASEIARMDNNELFKNIEIISTAIKKNKKISFNYLSYDVDKELKEKYDENKVVSPLFLCNTQGKYYLICAFNEKKEYNYRLDFMKHITILDEPGLVTSDIKTLGKYFNKADYINKHFYTFSGDNIAVQIEILNKNGINSVYDWFKNAKISKTSDGKIIGSFTANENAIFYWALQYHQQIKLLYPPSIIKKIKDAISTLQEQYKEQN